MGDLRGGNLEFRRAEDLLAIAAELAVNRAAGNAEKPCRDVLVAAYVVESLLYDALLDIVQGSTDWDNQMLGLFLCFADVGR